MKRIIGFTLTLFSLLVVSGFSDIKAAVGRIEDPDPDALKNWLKDKRIVTVKEIGGDLVFSGEVRTEMQATHEEHDGIKFRGRHSITHRPTVAYDVEFNLMLDYRSERSWASVKIEFDNDMGTVSGSVNHLALERAYLGGRLIPGETFIFDAELGRRNFNSVFDSKIEFASIFDGLLFKFNKSFEKIGNFYVNGGPFIVNDRKNHYGAVAELGMLKIGNTGCYIKYSIIDWRKHSNRPLVNWAFKFIDSQFSLGYQGEIPKWNNKFLKIYSAYLVNIAAEGNPLTKGKKENIGAYAGFSLGQLRKKGDWALDANYQVVQAQAVPDYDSAGIKRGNAEDVGFYSLGRFGSGERTTLLTAVGGGNFRGFAIELLYGLTNNLTLFQNFQMSRTLNTDIGPLIRFYQYEMEFIYAF